MEGGLPAVAEFPAVKYEGNPPQRPQNGRAGFQPRRKSPHSYRGFSRHDDGRENFPTEFDNYVVY